MDRQEPPRSLRPGGGAGDPAGSGSPRPRRRTPEARAERLAAHAAETDPAAVMAAAVRLLETRSRTVSDVRGRLVKAGYRTELVTVTVDRLVELGLLDDEAYARGWLDARDRGRPRGERALRQELRLRGVPADVAAAALDDRRAAAAEDADGLDSAADEAAARLLLDRRSRSWARGGDQRTARQRAYALLARNGFDPDIAARVAAEASAAVGAGADADADLAEDADPNP